MIFALRPVCPPCALNLGSLSSRAVPGCRKERGDWSVLGADSLGEVLLR